MASPSQLHAARTAPDRRARTQAMADFMMNLEANEGACTYAQLCAAGFLEAEIEAYRDDARALIGGRTITETFPDGRLEGRALVIQAQAIRARHAAASAEAVTP